MSYKRVTCKACGPLSRPNPSCHECKGLGYVEYRTRHPECKGMNCPMMEFEAMTWGWMCNYCGESGPL